jgi:hypothetical protein
MEKNPGLRPTFFKERKTGTGKSEAAEIIIVSHMQDAKSCVLQEVEFCFLYAGFTRAFGISQSIFWVSSSLMSRMGWASLEIVPMDFEVAKPESSKLEQGEQLSC